MVKIQRPLNSQKARGAIGGVIFSESNNVNYVRRNTIKPYDQTGRRKEQATLLADASTAWHLLDDETRKAWEIFAETTNTKNAFGEDTTIPAFSWFVSCYKNLRAVERTLTPRISSMVFPETPTAVSKRWRRLGLAYALQINVTTPSQSRDYRYRIYQSKEPSTSRLYNISECQVMHATAYAYQGTSFTVIPADTGKYAGTWTLYVQTIDANSGLASDFYKTKLELTFNT